MLVVGLILILLSAGAVVGVLASGTDDKAVLYSATLQMPTLVVFLAGAATLLVFIMGLELVRSGIRRAGENRKTKKRLRKLEAREEQRTEPATADDARADATGSPAAQSETTTAPTAGEHAGTEPETRGKPHQDPPPPSR